MRKKKILFINGHLNVGGIESSLVNVLNNLDYETYDVTLILFQGGGHYISEIPKHIHLYCYDVKESYGPFKDVLINSIRNNSVDILLYRIIWGLGSKVSYIFFKLLKYIFKPLNPKYDVAISYRTDMCNTILTYCVSADKKISWWHHGSFCYNNVQKEALRKEYNKIDQIVCVSRNTKDLIGTIYSESVQKLSVISNIIDTSRIYAGAMQKIDIFDSPHPIIISVGRLFEDKNPRLCIKTAKILRDKGYRFHWFILGDGEELPKMDNDISLSNLQNCVSLLGAVSNPYPWISKSDIFFHSSPIESQGLAILEAMALEKPVICVRSAGPSEFIENGENGLFIDNDAQQGADAIMLLIDNPDKSRLIARNARNTVKQFESERIMPLIYKLLNDN